MTNLLDATSFKQDLEKNRNPIPVYKAALKNGYTILKKRFEEGDDIALLVKERSLLIDRILTNAWEQFFSPHELDISLVAVGGYGRSELHPGSDIDLMILARGEIDESHKRKIEGFLVFLWDIGLEVGHSVRTLDECVVEASQDITVATNLMEARHLCGARELFTAMRASTGPDQIWPSNQFFEAKWAEQVQRHKKFDDTGYKLEPNVKEGPGGLRDIQMIGWVVKRHFGADTLHDLVTKGFLKEYEYQSLLEGQKYLWKIRFALHILTGRREDRLLFDYQRTLATRFGYVDSGHSLAVEQFMQRYYQTIMELARLNEMLLQLFQEAILFADEPPVIVTINKRFRAIRGFIEVTHENVFQHYPFALLEIFLLLEMNQDLKGVRATTIRLIRNNRYLIDDKFRNDLRAKSLFMEIIRQPSGVTHELRRMNRYGILAAYLPAFGKIVGRMQYDLFHVLTVDEHTLFVVRNMRRFTVPEFSNELPLCSSLIADLPKPELLYLAGLFHDIAKGRGGDHSTLGAEDARDFCLSHGLSQYDAKLVAWLVQNHLIMSMTAQRKDISDPEVIGEFASTVGDLNRLNYLYLLTVADIRATNPTLWNSWKDALLRDLYNSTKRAIRKGTGKSIDMEDLVQETRDSAIALLLQAGIKTSDIDSCWMQFDDEYFLRFTAEEITWHTEAILKTEPGSLPIVLVQPDSKRGSTSIFIYSVEQEHQFAITTAALEQISLNIVDARIISTNDHHQLASFLVLEESGDIIRDNYRLKEIQSILGEKLKYPKESIRVSRRIPRQHKHFDIETVIEFTTDPHSNRTILEVISADMPGLLSRIGQAFREYDIRLHNARITTIGARIEDIFYITDHRDNPLENEDIQQKLRLRIIELLKQ